MRIRTMGGLGALVLLILLVPGCTLFESDYTIEVANLTNVPVDIYYQTTGGTEWTEAKTMLSSSTGYMDIAQGTYDFRAVISGAKVDDSGSILGTAESCLVDTHYDFDGESQSYDYNLNVRTSAVSFY